MATLVMTSSWNPGRLRVTYETFAGGMKITKLEGCRTDGSSSYLTNKKSVTFYTVSGYKQTVAISNHVRFNANSSYYDWALTNTIYVHGSGSVTLYIKLPTGSVAWSGATFSGTFTLPAYTGPSVASASAASNATGAITYSGSGSQGTQLIPSLLTASGYTQVNYVTAAGNTWIDTGLKAKSTTRIDCAFQYTSTTTQQRVFGTGVDDASGQLSVHVYINGNGSMAWAYQNTVGNWTSLFTQYDNKVHTIKVDAQNNTVVFDGQSRTMGTTRTNTSTDNIALFGRSNGSNYMTGNIYCCRIYEGGTLVRDFVPAKRNSDSVYGLYDVKNGAFYTGKVNALSGTTSFNSPYVWNVNGNINAMSGTKTGLSQNTAYTCTFTVRDVLGLTASWSQSVTTKGSWTVSYAANGGTSTPASQTKNYNVALTLASAISKNNTTQNGYTVTFDPNTGSVSPTSKTATDTVKWTFSKWKATDGTQYNASASYTANASTTMTAQWTSTISSHGSITTPSASKTAGTSTRKVDFDAATNGGSCSTASLNSTATVTYSSSGWYTATSGGTKRCVNGGSYTPSSSETVHAQWTSSTGSFSAITLPNATHADSSSTRTVSFDATTNGGTCSTASLNSIATVTHPLNGWYTANSGGTKRGTYNQTYTPSAAEKLYAQFGSSTGTFPAITLPAATKANGSTSWTITINANGGTSTIATLTSEATITYSQTGWWTSASGGTNRGNSGATYTPSATEQVYAQFSSSTGTYSSVTFPTAAECIKEGYILLGFSTSSTATTPTYQPGESFTPNQSDIYYAIWQAAIKKIDYKVNGVWKKGIVYIKTDEVWKLSYKQSGDTEDTIETYSNYDDLLTALDRDIVATDITIELVPNGWRQSENVFIKVNGVWKEVIY